MSTLKILYNVQCLKVKNLMDFKNLIGGDLEIDLFSFTLDIGVNAFQSNHVFFGLLRSKVPFDSKK